MSYCDTCIHRDVCGVEGANDEATVYCADRIEPCEDAISRQAVLGLAKKGVLISNGNYKSVCKVINELPSVNSQPKTGHWIEEDMFDGDVAYRCSECNELFWIESGTPKDNEFNFCPKCGKRWVEPQESEVTDADSN